MAGQLAERGHVLIGQSGGPTAVINASLVGAIHEAQRLDAVDGIYGALNGIEGALARRIIDLRRESAATLQALLHTPSAALGSCRYKLQPEDPARAVNLMRELGIRYFLYIGGNDSADTAHRVAQAAEEMGYDLRVIGIPKTIDNDLPVTDHCPGYGSAARFIAMMTQDSARNTEAMPEHYPVKIIEVMGRYAGWLAAAAALGRQKPEDAPHLIYMPEYAFDPNDFLSRVRATVRQRSYCVVVVAEHLADAAGRQLGEAMAQGVDAFGHPLVAGVAQTLVDLVRSELGMRARFDKPGDMQRMSTMHISATDRDEAYQAGRMALRYAVRGVTGKMVTLVRTNGPRYACETGLADLERIANEQKLMPANYVTPDGVNVTPAFLDYVRPLIGDPLPQHATLRGERLQ
ncbi:MAG: 6-phosphofructokinase [Ktedonobacterales bacterium]|nr:6-phosphofructokinase [Ktedonobacterales bacterium]